jgi:hypothetical protein
MQRLKLQALDEIETEQLQAVARRELITVTVPLTDLFARSYCYFYKLHGCTVIETNERMHNMRLYRFTFPAGTEWQQVASESYLLTLPDETRIDVVRTQEGHVNLYIHDIANINNVFMQELLQTVWPEFGPGLL